jgi:glycosyltransferase involved in cell wall biosynthesis
MIVVRPRDPYLNEAIISVLNQTLTCAKILVVVNGSSDPDCESMAVVKSFGNPVEGLLLEELGIVPALNEGISQVVTPYLAFVDSDDLWVETKQEQQLSILNSDSSIDAVNSIVTNFRGGPDGKREFLNSAQSSVRAAVTFRSDVFSRFGAFDPVSSHFTHLYRWYAQAIRRGLAVSRQNEIGLLRRIHSDNGWVKDRQKGMSELQSELRALARQKRGERGEHV